jgi:hypothetical protein
MSTMNVFAQFSGTGTVLFLVGMVLVIGILLRRSHRYFGRRPKNPSVMVRTERPETQQKGHHLDSPDELVRWEVEMHEIARELSARLDTKIGVLAQLIRDADRASDRLEAALKAERQDEQDEKGRQDLQD